MGRTHSFARVVAGLAVGVALLCGAAARPSTSAATPGPGQTEQRSYAHGYRAIVYTPAQLDRSHPAPLVVMLHGCNWTAASQEAGSDFDWKAEQGRFVVLYPDFEANRTPPCWHARSDTTRNSDDPAAIAAMIRDAIRRRSPRVDRTRVYVAGVSSGAMMTVVLGATYPDLVAGIAVNAGCAFRATTCLNAPPSRPSATLAREALHASGRRMHVMPVLILHGDQDTTVPFAHADQLLAQWRMTDNLALSGTLQRPIRTSPTRVRTTPTMDGRSATIESYHGVIQRWTIHGGVHCWLNPNPGPAHVANEPQPPDACDAIWSFLRRYRLN